MRTIEIYLMKFLNIPVQNFTEKLMCAKSLIPHLELTEDEVYRISWLERNTHENLCVSMYELDFWVNPGNVRDPHIKLLKNPEYIGKLYGEDNKVLELNKDTGGDAYRMQRYLCFAIMEIQDIISRNIKGFNFEELMMRPKKGGGVTF